MFLLPIETISFRGQVKEKLLRPKESQKKLLSHSLSVLVSEQVVTLRLHVRLDGHQVSEKSRGIT